MLPTHNGNLGDIFLRNGIKLIELFYKRFMERFSASKGIILEVYL